MNETNVAYPNGINPNVKNIIIENTDAIIADSGNHKLAPILAKLMKTTKNKAPLLPILSHKKFSVKSFTNVFKEVDGLIFVVKIAEYTELWLSTVNTNEPDELDLHSL